MKLFYFLIPSLVLFCCGQQPRVSVSKEDNTNINKVLDTLGVNEKLDILAVKMNMMSGIIDSLTLLNQNQEQEIYLLKSSVKASLDSNNIKFQNKISRMESSDDKIEGVRNDINGVRNDIRKFSDQIQDLYAKIKNQNDRLMGEAVSYSYSDGLYNLNGKVERFENKIRSMESAISDLKKAIQN